MESKKEPDSTTNNPQITPQNKRDVFNTLRIGLLFIKNQLFFFISFIHKALTLENDFVFVSISIYELKWVKSEGKVSVVWPLGSLL